MKQILRSIINGVLYVLAGTAGALVVVLIVMVILIETGA